MDFIWGGDHDHDDPEHAERLAGLHEAHLRRIPRDNELPGPLAVALVLGRTDEAVVALHGGAVHSNGLELEIVLRLRSGGNGSRDLSMALHGHSHFGDPEQAILLGVVYPDDRFATNLDTERWHTDRPTLNPGSGGGDDRSHRTRFWLTPLPPPGDLTVVCAWPAHGLAETRTVVPAEALARGLSEVTELWPWEPPQMDARPEPTPLVLPPGGWFAEVMGEGQKE